MKKWIIGGVLFALIFPLILNIILNQKRFVDGIIGNEETWLTFWGSYLGSIIAMIVPFVILWKEIQFNMQEANKERKYQEIVRIKTDLAERISLVNFSSLIKTMPYAEITPEIEIQRLQDLNELYIKLMNITKILYGYSRKDEEVKFCSAYCNALKKAVEISNKLIIFLSSMPRNEKLNEDNYNKFVECRACLKNEYDLLLDYYKENVYSTAIDYIQSLERQHIESC